MDGIACKPALHMELHVRLAKIAVAQATAMHAIQIKSKILELYGRCVKHLSYVIPLCCAIQRASC